jgi:transposase-like protein
MGKSTEDREKYWRERVAAQERSGLSVKQFCEQQQITEQTFYVWRKRLRNQEPMRFALVETGVVRPQPPGESGLELVLTTGERLHIGVSVDLSTLRKVLEALRG